MYFIIPFSPRSYYINLKFSSYFYNRQRAQYKEILVAHERY